MPEFKIKLFTYLKNTDLACLTAEDSIKNLLNFKDLLQLTRYQLWEIVVVAQTQAEAEAQIEAIIKSSYYLINPNKEDYFLTALPQKKLDADKTCFLVKVYNPDGLAQTDLLEKIVRKTKVEIKSLTKAALWEMVLKADHAGKDVQQEKLIQEVLLSTSIQKGILVNSIFERYEFI